MLINSACVERVKIGMILASAALLGGCSADIAQVRSGHAEAQERTPTAPAETTYRTYSTGSWIGAPYDRAPSGSSVSRSDLPAAAGLADHQRDRPALSGWRPAAQAAYNNSGAPSYGKGSGGYGQRLWFSPAGRRRLDLPQLPCSSQNGSSSQSGSSRAPSYGASTSQCAASGYSNAPASGRGRRLRRT